MRKIKLEENGIAHVYTRGVRKMRLFHDEEDYYRMVYYLLLFQYPYRSHKFNYFSKRVQLFLQTKKFIVPEQVRRLNEKTIDLFSFCLMRNHLHLSVLQSALGEISVYMRRVQGAYGHYYNHKYDLKGHVFENSYKIKKISTNRSFIRNTAYIHRNPYIYANKTSQTDSVFKSICNYPFSSLNDLYKGNRWGMCFENDNFLERSGITKDEYFHFLKDYISVFNIKPSGLDILRKNQYL